LFKLKLRGNPCVYYDLYTSHIQLVREQCHSQGDTVTCVADQLPPLLFTIASSVPDNLLCRRVQGIHM